MSATTSTLKRVPNPDVKLRTLYDVPLEKTALEHSLYSGHSSLWRDRGSCFHSLDSAKHLSIHLCRHEHPTLRPSLGRHTSAQRQNPQLASTPATVCQQLQIGTAIRNWPWAVWYVGEAGDKLWKVSGAGDKLSLVYQVIWWYLNLSLCKKCKST